MESMLLLLLLLWWLSFVREVWICGGGTEEFAAPLAEAIGK